MDDLYIRVRGRVLGPYDQEKLQMLARRGQLSRMHELSADGASWVRAANYPELFTGAVAEMPAARGMGQQSGSGYSEPQVGAAPPRPAMWYYASGGVQRGPVDFSDLQQLMATGQMRPDDLVWSEGMQTWTHASQVPALAPPSTRPTIGGDSVFCRQCGTRIPAAAFICMHCGVPTDGTRPAPASPSGLRSDKSRLAYILLGVFLGGLGIHNFYAGYAGKGVCQLLITIFSFALLFLPLIVVWIWVLVEICTVTHDAQGRPFAS